jgi:N-acetylmuramoyl-L-alanine amidase
MDFRAGFEACRWTRAHRARQGRGVSALLALTIGWLGAPAQAATVQSVRVTDGRIVIRFDAPVRDAASLIAPDARQILVQVRDAAPGTGGAAAGPVRRITQARRDGGARIAFALSRPAVVGDAEFTANGRELRLELQPASEATFAAAGETGWSRYFPFSFGRARPKAVQAVPRARATRLPRVQGEAGKPLVVIDAGHGGVDPGAIAPGSGLREKDLTLRIAKAIRDQLVASGRARVALTREDDRYLVLRERFGIARKLNADLFISIHCDSVGHEDATGASVYTLSEVASDREAARLAVRENKVDLIDGVDLGEGAEDVRSILIDLTQRETMNASAGFARVLGREAKPLIPVKAQFHRMASLMVLKAPDLPSVLFETGYISNPRDAEFLASEEGQERIARSVRRAVEVHFARRMAGD